jgi:copper homeostasis protein CutC
VRQLVASTGVREVHLSATTWLPSAMTFVRRDVAMGNSAAVDEYSVRTTDGAQVAQTVAALRGA